MVAPVAGAALIKALGSKAAVKSTAKFAAGMKSMEKTSKDGGLDAFRDGMDKMSNFAANFQPIAMPMQVITAQIQAETMGSNVKLMNTFMSLFQSEAAQAALKNWTTFLNGMNEFGAGVVTGVELISTGMYEMGQHFTDANVPMREHIGHLEDLTAQVELINETYSKGAERLADLNTTAKEGFLESIGETFSGGTGYSQF